MGQIVCHALQTVWNVLVTACAFDAVAIVFIFTSLITQ